MSNYPAGIDSFTRKVDGVDTIIANDINELQEAVEHVEGALGANPAGTADTVAERLEGIDDAIENVVVPDTHVTLSEGNAGSYSTLDEHVKDLNIHAPLDAISYNYPQMLARTLDPLMRSALTSGKPLNYAQTSTESAFPLDKGDVVFCYTPSNSLCHLPIERCNHSS